MANKDKNPMSYFDPKNAMDLIQENQKELLDHVEKIIGFSTLKSYLETMTESQKFYDFRRRYGLKGHGQYMPDVSIIVGAGDKRQASRYLSQYYKKATLIKTGNIYRVNINDCITYYTSDAQKCVEKAFEDAQNATLVIDGFEELIANPRPSFADYQDWDDVLCDLLAKEIVKHSHHTCIMLSMSQKTYDHLLECYPIFRQLNRKRISCPRYNADEIVKTLKQKINDNGYQCEEGVSQKLTQIFQQMVCQDIKVRDEFAIKIMFKKILEKQKNRLSNVPLNYLSKSRLKSILATDIPTISIPVDRDNVIYI